MGWIIFGATGLGLIFLSFHPGIYQGLISDLFHYFIARCLIAWKIGVALQLLEINLYSLFYITLLSFITDQVTRVGFPVLERRVLGILLGMGMGRFTAPGSLRFLHQGRIPGRSITLGDVIIGS